MNQVYEANVPETYKKPLPDAKQDERAAWIRAKYVQRLFVRPSSRAPDQVTKMFYKACRKDRVCEMLYYFAHGADINARFPPHDRFATACSG